MSLIREMILTGSFSIYFYEADGARPAFRKVAGVRKECARRGRKIPVRQHEPVIVPIVRLAPKRDSRSPTINKRSPPTNRGPVGSPCVASGRKNDLNLRPVCVPYGRRSFENRRSVAIFTASPDADPSRIGEMKGKVDGYLI